MKNYIAIVDVEDAAHAVGVWFPDVPGCFSAGDNFDQALANAEEALSVHLEVLKDEGLDVPQPRAFEQLLADPDTAEDVRRYIVAVVSLKDRPLSAAA